MASVTYLDFDLSVDRTDGGYCARVLRSPCGEAEHRFQRPLSELELRDFGSGVVRHRQGMRGASSGDIDRVKEYGARLYDTVFGGAVQTCLLNSIREARGRTETGLRIRLRLNGAPELAELPWEYLYRTDVRRFLALATDTPIVRYLDLPDAARPIAVKAPLRILAMISSPSDAEPLDVTAEWKNLQTALGELEARGEVVLHRLETATLDALRWKLREQEYHVFHYIGHAGFDPYTKRGLLVLEDEQGRSALTSAEQLSVVLFDEDTLRLVVLNACEGGRTAADDIFAGTAQTLVQKDVPAVVAMQFAISDVAAITFARDFYRSLAYGDPVDTAVTQARQAIFARNELEWGTPVLYMRASEGRLFDVRPTPAPVPVGSPLAPATPERPVRSLDLAEQLARARVALGAEEWDRAIDTLNLVLARFTGDDEAFSLMRRAREQKELATVYTNALRHEAAGEWQQALTCFDRLHSLAGARYKDSEARAAHVQRQRTLQIAAAAPVTAAPVTAAPVIPSPVVTSPSAAPPGDAPRFMPLKGPTPQPRAAAGQLKRWSVGCSVVLVAAVALVAVMPDSDSPVTSDMDVTTAASAAPITAASVANTQAWDAHLTGQGLVPVTEWAGSSLRTGGEDFHTIVLGSKVTYRIAGACDKDCGDLDMMLANPVGERVVEDVLPDSLPVLRWTPADAGSYELTVRMVRCSIEPCVYAYRVYAETP